MTRKLPHDEDLLDYDEAAGLLEVTRSTVVTYQKRAVARRAAGLETDRTFPEPARRVGQSPMWRRADLDAWRLGRRA